MLALISVSWFANLVPEASERCLALSSSEARRRFVSSPALEREVVLVPDTMNAGDARALGLALRADVARDGERWRIARTAVQVRAVRGEDLAWLRSRASVVVAGVEAAAARYPGSSSDGFWETYRAAKARFDAGGDGTFDLSLARAESATPTARLLASLLTAVPDATLALSEPGATTVFSNAPLGEERPLPVPKGAVKAYLAAQERFAEWAQRAGEAEVSEADRGALPCAPPRPGGRTLLLKIARGAGEIAFALSIYNDQGKADPCVRLAPSAFPAPKLPSLSVKLGSADLPPDIRREVAEATPGDPIFRAVALDPDARDPLDREARAALLLYSHAKGFEHVVGCVPDGALRIVRAATRDGRVDLDALARDLPGLGIEEVPSGETLVLRPAHPALEEALRLDRRPLAAEYRAAVKGVFGIDALLALHAAYAREWGERWMLDTEQRAFATAFRLAESPNWRLPHAMLAAVGSLPSEARARLMAGSSVGLDSPAASDACLGLAAYAASQAAFIRLLSKEGGEVSVPTDVREFDLGSALAKEPTRLLARAPVLLTAQAATKTLVKHVSRGKATIHSYDPNTHEITERTGENLVLDKDYGPLDDGMTLRMGIPPERAYTILDRRYRFLWSQEAQLKVTATVAGAYRVGPVILREPLRQSERPVPLAEVPGVDYRPQKNP